MQAQTEGLKMPSLEEQIQKVRDLRVSRNVIGAKVAELHERFDLENRGILDQLATLRQNQEIEEGILREMTLIAYQETGNKKPAAGVGIRITKSLQYDEDKAVHWCVDHQFLNCLDLNKINFKKVAEGLGPEFVEVQEVAQATIAKELP